MCKHTHCNRKKKAPNKRLNAWLCAIRLRALEVVIFFVLFSLLLVLNPLKVSTLCFYICLRYTCLCRFFVRNILFCSGPFTQCTSYLMALPNLHSLKRLCSYSLSHSVVSLCILTTWNAHANLFLLLLLLLKLIKHFLFFSTVHE